MAVASAARCALMKARNALRAFENVRETASNILEWHEEYARHVLDKLRETHEAWNEACSVTPLPLSKVSGFQKASLALAMRIAMARLSGRGVTNRHMFIDEGFAACDADNMKRVPAFLRALIDSRRCDSILMISHVDVIREGADECIPYQTSYRHV